MTFVTPWLILGSIAIVIPVAIHLFLRRQPQKIEFPALRFVQQVEQTAKRSVRLRHLLLLLCRIGLIILLSLLLARPSITRSVSASSSAPTAAALLFDTSVRMNCQRDNQSLFDYALKEGQWALSRLPNGSQIAIIDSQTKTPAFAVDRSAAKYQLEQLKPAPGSLDFTGQIIKAAQLLESSSLGVKELYIFTDMSKAAWEAASAPVVASSLKKASLPTVYVIDVGAQNLVNDSVLPLRLEKEILAPGEKLNIGAVVKRSAAKSEELGVRSEELNNSQLPSRTLELYILDDSDKPVKRDEKILSSDLEQSVSFSLSGFEPGKYEGFVKLSGADAFAEDDCRWFSFERAGAKNVLLISAENQKSSFLTAALSPKLWRDEGRSRYNCDVVSQAEFDSESFGLDKMSKYNLTFLLNPAPMSVDGWKKLETWTQQGGGLCISLGDNASDVGAFNSPESQMVLAGKVQLQARAGDGVFVLPRSYVHPILVPFEKMASSVPWTQTSVFRYWQLSDFPSDVNVVLRYSDLRPFILERPVGAGRAVTITTPIDDSKGAWNALASAQNWVFFVLINQTADYLSSSGGNRLNYRAGETAEIKQDEENDDWKITMYSEPSGMSTSGKAPETQLVRAQKDVVRIPGLMTAGYIAAAPESEADSSEKIFLSFNYSEKDTDLTRLDADQLKDFFGSCPWSQSRDRKQIEQRVSTGRAGWELFPILAVLFCLLLGAETWLSERFYR